MIYIALTGIAFLSYAVYYLWKELKKSKELYKQVLGEVEESKKIRSSISIKDPSVIVQSDALDKVRREKFEERKREELDKRILQEEEGKAFRDLLDRASKGSRNNYDVWYNSESNCPPKSGSCPMMFYCIPAGESAVCSGCNKTIKSSAPMFLSK